MLRNYYLSIFIFATLGCTLTTKAANHEISNSSTTTVFIPTADSHSIIEDAICTREEIESKMDQQRKNNSSNDERLRMNNTTTQQVNATLALQKSDRAAELMLDEFNDTDCSKSTIKRENISKGDQNKVPNKNQCPSFKNGVEISLAELVGDWRTLFYKASQVVTCFKIHIKKMTFEEKLRSKERYGTFNRSVDWHNCHLEITGSKVKGRHFLQGGLGDEGVLRNIIIVKAKDGCHQLREEVPDQWRAFNHLLLFRACDNGDLIVFNRVGVRPSQDDVKAAVENFGETKFHGIPTCQDTLSPSENKTTNSHIHTADLDYGHDEENRNTVPVYDLI